MTRTSITGKQFDEERALYHLQNADVTDSVFAVFPCVILYGMLRDLP